MRTENIWETKHRQPFIKKHFTPRLQRDLELFRPKTLPSIDWASGQGLFLYGRTATGKTIMASELMIEERKRMWLELEDEKSPVFAFASAPAILREINQSFDAPKIAGKPALDSVFDFYTGAYFLTIDDIGVIAKQSDWLINTMYLIINTRYEQMLPTLYTSNFDIDKIGSVFDARIASRIERSCEIAEKQLPSEKH